MIKTEIIWVTPTVATLWLQKNINRVPRPAHVEAFRLMFTRGEFTTTHQGIAFDESGALMDGQHRLMAIAQMPADFRVQLMVTFGLPRNSAYEAIDTTIERRNIADVLHVPRSLGEVGNFLARIYTGQNTGNSPSYVKHFVDAYAPELEELIDFCPTVRRTWSSAAMRGAAALQMSNGNSDYVKSVYRALVQLNAAAMPPVALAFFKAVHSGPVHSGNRADLFARAMKVFDSKNESISRVQVKDISKALAEARQMMKRRIDVPVEPLRKPGRPLRTSNGHAEPGQPLRQ